MKSGTWVKGVMRGCIVCAILVGALRLPAHGAGNPADWTTPIAPFRIAGNLYYVGSRDLAAYLVVTPAGDILINSNLASSPPQIERSVMQLGFRMRDIKVLLISHAHTDHAAGSAAILRATGARYAVLDGDVDLVESGGRTDFAYGRGDMLFPRAKVDRVLHDGDTVRLGGTELMAHKTPGHTRGCTTWTMKVMEGGRTRDVVIVGSWSVNPGYRLVATKDGRPASYPGIADDYEHTFAVLRGLACDIFLGAHGVYFDMLGKLARMPREGEAVCVAPAGYRAAVLEQQTAFGREFLHQQASLARH